VRTAGDPRAWAAAVREEIRRVRPHAPVIAVVTLNEQINSRLTREWLLAILSGFFACVALTLAAVGVYGLLAYAVVRRVPEIGVRLALGARPATILWTTLRESLVLGAIGTGIGLGIATVVLRSAQAFLFGLSPSDTATLVGAAASLTVVGLAAAFIPARRAAAVDPLVTIRCE
jgi:putative ABC transport system permease protein